MRFLADQDVWFGTLGFLRRLGHEILTAREAGKSEASDAEMLRYARAGHRLLITRDKDYGSLFFLRGMEAAG